MARGIYQRACRRCGKTYLTRDSELEFCNDGCKAKLKYEEKHGEVKEVLVRGKCRCCGMDLYRKKAVFCTKQCEKAQRRKESVDNVKASKSVRKKTQVFFNYV